MKAYTYLRGELREHSIERISQLGSFSIPLAANTQVWIPTDGANWVTQWFILNARNRLCAVSKEACKELRTALLIQGVACP